MILNKSFSVLKSNKLFQNLSIYFVSQLVTAFLPIIIIPIISRELSLTEYGNYSLYKSIFGFLIPLVGLSFSNAVIRKYYKIKENQFSSYMFTLMFLIVTSLLLFGLIIFVNKHYLLKFLKLESSSIIFYSLFVAFLTSINSIILGYYRVTNNTKRFLQSNLIIFCFTLVGVLLLKNLVAFSLLNLLNVHLIAISLSFLYNLLFFFRKSSQIKLDFSKLKETLKYCIPLVIYSLLAQIYATSDRFLINYYLDKDKLALYSAGIQIAFAIPIIGQSIQLAWTPHVFEQLANKNENNKLKKHTLILSGAIIVFSILYLFIYPFIFKLLLPSNYNNVLNYYALFIFAGLFQSLYWLFNPFLLYYEKNQYFIFITLVAATTSLLLNFIFIKNGVIWVASVFALSWFIQFSLLLIAIKYVKYIEKNK